MRKMLLAKQSKDNCIPPLYNLKIARHMPTGFDSAQEVYKVVAETANDNSKSYKYVQKILRATTYKGFVRHMHRKSRAMKKLSDSV